MNACLLEDEVNRPGSYKHHNAATRNKNKKNQSGTAHKAVTHIMHPSRAVRAVCRSCVPLYPCCCFLVRYPPTCETPETRFTFKYASSPTPLPGTHPVSSPILPPFTLPAINSCQSFRLLECSPHAVLFGCIRCNLSQRLRTDVSPSTPWHTQPRRVGNVWPRVAAQNATQCCWQSASTMSACTHLWHTVLEALSKHAATGVSVAALPTIVASSCALAWTSDHFEGAP